MVQVAQLVWREVECCLLSFWGRGRPGQARAGWGSQPRSPALKTGGWGYILKVTLWVGVDNIVVKQRDLCPRLKSPSFRPPSFPINQNWVESKRNILAATWKIALKRVRMEQDGWCLTCVLERTSGSVKSLDVGGQRLLLLN